MTLTGPQISDLAAALAAANPDVERFNLDHDAVRALLAKLPGVVANDLTAAEITVVKWWWMRHADTAAGGRDG